jgi:hypothetical protein
MEPQQLKDEEDFQYWLIHMDDALDEFMSSLPEDVRAKLDFSIDSLTDVENLILNRYKTPEEMIAPGETSTLDGFARYIGETIRKNVGGSWQLRLDDPKYVYYGLPQITGYSERPTPVSPIAMATTAAARRTGSYLRGVVEGMKANP